ncbi:hypothetical protein GCM10029992_56340 [Glycomyces albus]
MRIPVSWLSEYAALPADLTTEALDAALVDAGLEVEEVHDLREQVTGPLVVGRVASIEELTEFKKPIRHCHVEVGEDEPRSIICGARNFAEGDLVVVALPGAVLPGGFAIGSRKTYGRLSDGMICSARELGVSDDHEGIMVLPEGVVGEDARPLLGLDEIVFELAITPDMGYCFSVRGVAREVAHQLGVAFTDPAAKAVEHPATPEPPHPLRVETDGCTRFTMRAVHGVDANADSPDWMAKRLAQAGMRPIGLAVDVTNYLMLELGHPLHAFDLDRLEGDLVVRRASPGEKLKTLDDVERALDPEDMVIYDNTGPLSLAGVMGGESSEVGPETRNVLVEAAHWDPVAIARTSRRHKLTSEASKRFERGSDPALSAIATQRAVDLLVEYGGGTLSSTSPTSTTAVRSNRSSSRSTCRRGRSVSTTTGRRWSRCSRPPVAPSRGRGAHRHPGELASRPDRPGRPGRGGRAAPRLPAYPLERAARAGRIGIDARAASPPPGGAGSGRQRLRGDLHVPVRLARARRRAGPGPGGPAARGDRGAQPARHRRAAAAHLGAGEPGGRGQDQPVARFAGPGDVRGGPGLQACRGLVGVREGRAAGLQEAERRGDFGGDPAAARAAAARGRGPVRPGRTGRGRGPRPPGRLGRRDRGRRGRGRGRRSEVGGRPRRAGPVAPGPLRRAEGRRRGRRPRRELHPEVCEALDLPKRTAAMELDLSAVPLPDLAPAPVISHYPATLIDVAVVVSEGVSAGEVEAALCEGAGALLESARLFDVYRDAKLGEEEVLAFKLALRAGDRTLTNEEGVAIRDAAVAVASERFGAAIRE